MHTECGLDICHLSSNSIPWSGETALLYCQRPGHGVLVGHHPSPLRVPRLSLPLLWVVSLERSARSRCELLAHRQAERHLDPLCEPCCHKCLDLCDPSPPSSSVRHRIICGPALQWDLWWLELLWCFSVWEHGL